MSDDAKRFRDRALAKGAHNDIDRSMLEELADELDAEADKIDAEATKPEGAPRR